LKYDGRARQFSQNDFKLFDLIIAMDMSNKLTLLNHARSKRDEKKIYLLREFDPGGGRGDVPDPYYGGIKGFEDVFDIVERSCKGLLKTLEGGAIVDS
jgi:protein-tyrosine phosphatase